MNTLYILFIFMQTIVSSFLTQRSRYFAMNTRTTPVLNNDFLKDKKLISISPGGFKGIYMLGVCLFIKDTFELDDYVFSGASAGAWNALTLCYKKDPKLIKEDVLDYSLKHAKNIYEIEKLMKDRFLLYTKTEDFDLRRLFIGVTTVQGLKTNAHIFYGFSNLEDALDCCIASSHIPFITGGLVNKYRNIYTFDGGFSKYPYLNSINSTLHISPSMWKEKPGHQRTNIFDITQYTTLFSRNAMDFNNLYESGYNDSVKNHDYLKYFLSNPQTL